MLSIAIIGGTGYTGLELIRLGLNHPKIKIMAVTSETWAGKKLADAAPTFRDETDLTLEKLNIEAICPKVDLVFLCLPHQKAMNTAKAFLEKGKKVIDLSADFRLNSTEIYESWYGPHHCSELLKEAVYGLPELHRSAIEKANLVANPGCYPTACILGLAPLMKQSWVDLKSIHCDAKSGVSGAGRSPELSKLFGEISENFKAYKVGQHRHTPEIEQEFSHLSGQDIKVSFTPHLIPINRGILATLYIKAKKELSSFELHQHFSQFYQSEPFVKVSPMGDFPHTGQVRFSNECRIGIHFDTRTQRIIVISVIDNLVKGASGQALQNMNIMSGYEESTGLKSIAPVV